MTVLPKSNDLEERRKRMNSRALEAKMAFMKVSITAMCEQLKIDRTTWWRKINQYVDFTRIEISIIAQVLKLTDEEIIQIFFPESCQMATN